MQDMIEGIRLSGTARASGAKRGFVRRCRGVLCASSDLIRSSLSSFRICAAMFSMRRVCSFSASSKRCLSPLICLSFSLFLARNEITCSLVASSSDVSFSTACSRALATFLTRSSSTCSASMSASDALPILAIFFSSSAILSSASCVARRKTSHARACMPSRAHMNGMRMQHAECEGIARGHASTPR